ncbi:hypothetical protein J6590_106879, partial [Homalodisca vitripennis]
MNSRRLRLLETTARSGIQRARATLEPHRIHAMFNFVKLVNCTHVFWHLGGSLPALTQPEARVPFGAARPVTARSFRRACPRS